MCSSNVCLPNVMLWDSPTALSCCWAMRLCGYATLQSPLIHSAAGSHCLSCFLFGILRGFPRGSDGKELAYNVGDLHLIPASEKSPGEGNGNPLRYSWTGGSHGQRSLVGCSPRGSQRVRHAERLTLPLSLHWGITRSVAINILVPASWWYMFMGLLGCDLP